LSDARRAVADRVALQGNLDPSALLGPPEAVRAETLRVLDSFGAGPGHVFNLGHGITPEVDPDRVAVVVETVQAYRG
jgi:uroporphyrinogen decarboxylase